MYRQELLQPATGAGSWSRAPRGPAERLGQARQLLVDARRGGEGGAPAGGARPELLRACRGREERHGPRSARILGRDAPPRVRQGCVGRSRRRPLSVTTGDLGGGNRRPGAASGGARRGRRRRPRPARRALRRRSGPADGTRSWASLEGTWRSVGGCSGSRRTVGARYDGPARATGGPAPNRPPAEGLPHDPSVHVLRPHPAAGPGRRRGRRARAAGARRLHPSRRGPGARRPPLGSRPGRKVEQIVREEQEAIGRPGGAVSALQAREPGRTHRAVGRIRPHPVPACRTASRTTTCSRPPTRRCSRSR